MISVGDPSEFAIQCEFTNAVKEFVYGRFRFVFRNQCCGDWNDNALLSGCVSWLREFSEHPLDRYEPGFLTMTSHEVHEALIKPFLNDGSESPDDPDEIEKYGNLHNRFDISHLGMSSFSLVSMVLIEDEREQRCVWTAGSSPKIHDYRYRAGLMQSVSGRFCEELRKELSDFGISL